VEAIGAEGQQEQRAGGYRRSAGTERGQARRRQLLDDVADYLAANGLVDFSLRRVAQAIGTTHKVLLYHFDGPEALLRQAVEELRDRRIVGAVEAMVLAGEDRPLAARVRAIWSALSGDEGRVLDQAIGLSMYDPERYAGLGRGASQQYLPALLRICPDDWSEARKREVSVMILATLRGLLVGRVTGADESDVEAGLDALGRALDREEERPGPDLDTM
jgi:AcrR family transcriptional regulator